MSDKTYNIETRFGCITNEIIVNGKNYFDFFEEPRGNLTDEERSEFDEALLREIDDIRSLQFSYGVRKRFAAGEIGILDLLNFLHADDVEVLPPCEQCEDTVTITYYSL